MIRTDRTDWTPWLGPAADEMTDEQREMFDRIADDLCARYPDRDDDRAEQAMWGAVQVILGGDTVDGLVDAWSRARAAEREAMAVLAGGLAAAIAQGDSENGISSRTGLNRQTIRKAVGK